MGRPAPFRGTSRFVLRSRLGSGGMGVVYEAEDTQRGLRVALKTLRRVDAEMVVRLKREFRALADIRHANLVELGELVEEAGQWFFTMELVEGETFVSAAREALTGTTDDASAFDVVRSLFAQLARGLNAIHAAGKVHRDVKPSNVLVTPEGRVVVLDFGLVAAAGADVPTAGTEGYIAPEHAAGEVAGPPADWFAYGVMLSEVLEGRRLDPTLHALCRDLAAPRPELRPSALEVLEGIGQRRRARGLARASSEEPWFVGREAELARLHASSAKAASGVATCVAIVGESGIGKSTVIDRFLHALASGPGGLVLRGRASPRETLPFKAFDGVIDDLARALSTFEDAALSELLPPGAESLARVFPALARAVVHAPAAVSGGGEVGDERSRTFEATRKLFSHLAARGPCVIAIEDMQWMDADSLALLAHVLSPPEPPPIFLLLSSRTPVLPGTLPIAVDELALGALGREQAQSLARSILEGGGGDTRDLDEIVEMAAGRPLFIDALARNAASFGASTGARVEDALWARIDRLDAAAQSALFAVCASSVPLSRGLLSSLSSTDAAEVHRSAEALRAAHLVVQTAAHGKEGLEPAHDSVREVVLARLGPDVVRAWHARLARSLSDSDTAEPEALAFHWYAAGEAAQAAPHARAGAERAERALAFERAARLWLMALEHEGESVEILERAARALANGGRGVEAAEVFLRAATAAKREGAPRTYIARLERHAAEELLLAGHFERGRDLLREVLDHLGIPLSRTPTGALAGVMWHRMRLRMRGLEPSRAPEGELDPLAVERVDAARAAARGLGMFDLIHGAHFQSVFSRLALDLGDPERVAQAVAMEAPFVASAGDDARAGKLLRMAHGLAHLSGDPQLRGLAEFGTGFTALQQGRFRPARVMLARAEATFRSCPGATRWERLSCFVAEAWCAGYLGDLSELARSVPVRLRVAIDRGDVAAATLIRTGMPNLAWLAIDDPAGARREIALAMGEWTQRGFQMPRAFALIAETHADLYEGRGSAARARLDDNWDALKRSMLLYNDLIRVTLHDLRARALLAEAISVDEGARAPLLARAEKDANLLLEAKTRWPIPLADLLLAGVALLRGDLDDARAKLAAAAVGFDEADMALHAAAARERLGEIEGGDGGRALRRQAAAVFGASGVRAPERIAAMLAPARPRS